MLSEARARLANTQGKKAKRKARERQLEEARRLAAVQKRRELRAAGIEWKYRKRHKGIDYNADIPLHQQAPAGFFDITEETEHERANKKELKSVRLDEIDGKRKAQEEMESRKKDNKRLRKQKESGEYVSADALKAARDAELMHSSRKRLNLPAPQVTDAELEEIAKIGYAGETAKAIAGSDDSASRALLNDYSSLPQTAMRTPRVPEMEDQVKVQARNLKMLNEAQTPLLGGDAIDIVGQMDFDGITPRKQVSATPNPLAAHLTPRAAETAPSATPGSSIFGRTPRRDELGINTPRFDGFGETPRFDISQVSDIKSRLASRFAKLPKPKDDFDIVIPEIEEVEETKMDIVEDAADQDAEIRAKQELARERELNRRSSAVKRDLPRPLKFDDNMFAPVAGESEVDRLIREEVKKLMLYDAVHHPMPGQLPVAVAPVMEEIEDEYISEALRLVKVELENVKKERGQIDFDKFIQQADDVEKSLVWTGKEYKKRSTIKDDEMKKILKNQLNAFRERMKAESQKVSKLDKKASTLLAGYQAVINKMHPSIESKYEALAQKRVELEVYGMMKIQEEAAIPTRIEKLREEVGVLARRESELQGEYAELLKRRNELMLAKQGGSVNGVCA